MRNTIITILILCFCFIVHSQIKISEIYTGGQSGSAIYKHDWVELYNSGNTAVTMNNWSIQYASASSTGTTTFGVSVFSGIIQPYSYFLVRVSSAGSFGAEVPYDVVGTGSLSFQESNGKVALCNTNSPLTPNTLFSAVNLVDFVGYGTANQWEGAAAISSVNKQVSIQRKAFSTSTSITMQLGGSDHLKGNSYDSNNNNLDLFTSIPEPQNTLSPQENPNSNSPTISSTPQAIDFGAIPLADESTPIEVTINPSNIEDAVTLTVTGSTDFLISKTFSGSYTHSIIFSLADLSQSQSYYVKFTPTSIGLKTADVVYSSANITAQSVSLQGSGFVPGSSSFNFNSCSGTISDGFTQFSVTGSQVWACSAFGRNSSNPSQDAPNGISINGFANSQNNPNEDWLISPALAITNNLLEYPLLSFWSRTKFSGSPLQIKISQNYTNGNPSSAAWTDLNVTLPDENSDIWTISENIDLSAFRGQLVKIAFVYSSTSTSGARWTIDDIEIINSATPPPPLISTNKLNINFGSVQNLSLNFNEFTLSGLRLTDPVLLSTQFPFQLSIDNVNFSTSLNLNPELVNNNTIPIYLQFSPTQDNQTYTSFVSITTQNGNSINLNLSGNTIDATKSLEVVCWNIEWFSDGTNKGPDNDALQEANVLKVMREINADVYGLGEIVDTLALKILVDSLGTNEFGYYVGKYASGAANASSGNYSTGQKLAYIYRKSMITPISFTPLFYTTNTSDPLYNYWASGRFPLMMEAQVTIESVTQPMTFILIHAKAQNSSDAYSRRKNAAIALKNYLDLNKPNERFIIFGDLNDDLDQTIAQSSDAPDYPLSSYSVIITDSMRYKSITLPLSYAGLKSTVGYNDVIDHIITSDEMQFEYIAGSADILKDVVEDLIPNYGTTTSDHYPVIARFSYQNAFLPVTFLDVSLIAEKNKVTIVWETSNEKSLKYYLVEKSEDGIFWKQIGKVDVTNQGMKQKYSALDPDAKSYIQYYRVRAIEEDLKYSFSKVVHFSKEISTDLYLYPNPATTTISFPSEFLHSKTISIYTSQGKLIKSKDDITASLDVSDLTRGIYFLKIIGGEDHQLFRFTKQ